jgi:dTDP-3-amino-3,4,6-trideoxy-alpha-D-glucose transaminase
VHLYGQPADMPALAAVADRHGCALIEDACQAHGATAAGRPVGTYGIAGAFSFYPTKNLGALGDAGAVTTSDATLAAKLKRLRNGGQTDRYHHPESGVNSRLDELQAAILRARLPFLAGWTTRRRELADAYRRRLAGTAVEVPPECDPGHVYHLFVVRTAARDRFQAHLADRGVGTLVHYPIALPRQGAFAGSPADCPAADRACAEVCSLPLSPDLDDASLAVVSEAVAAWRI